MNCAIIYPARALGNISQDVAYMYRITRVNLFIDRRQTNRMIEIQFTIRKNIGLLTKKINKSYL